MEYKDIVLIVLVVGMLFMATKVYKNNNIEKFEQEQVELIKEEINRQYNMDIEAIRNLGAISKSLLTGTNYHSTEPSNPGTLTIPANVIIEGKLNILPKGCVIMWAIKETPVPEGWVACDSSEEAKEAGAPDLTNKFILGGNDIGKTGGETEVTLSEAQIPKHTHSYKNNGSTNKAWTAIQGSWMYDDAVRGALGIDKTTGSSGESNAHNNMPPFYVLIYIMKL
jgi:hypothetical protein